MKTLLKLISFAGLALMFLSAILVFNDAVTKPTYQILALVGTLLWFIPVPFWMKRRLHHSE
jgi:hypothetical protein